MCIELEASAQTWVKHWLSFNLRLAARRQRGHVHTPTPPYFYTARHVQVRWEDSLFLPVLPPTIYL